MVQPRLGPGVGCLGHMCLGDPVPASPANRGSVTGLRLPAVGRGRAKEIPGLSSPPERRGAASMPWLCPTTGRGRAHTDRRAVRRGVGRPFRSVRRSDRTKGKTSRERAGPTGLRSSRGFGGRSRAGRNARSGLWRLVGGDSRGAPLSRARRRLFIGTPAAGPVLRGTLPPALATRTPVC